MNGGTEGATSTANRLRLYYTQVSRWALPTLRRAMRHAVADPSPAKDVANPLLEYVTSSGCSDCGRFEALVARVAPDFPTVEVRAVAADSVRGTVLSLGHGIMRFPVIVLEGEVLAIESIAEGDLRMALARLTGASQ